MPDYKPAWKANWVELRSWQGLREALVEFREQGECIADFRVRQAREDEARADEHPETRDLFLASLDPDESPMGDDSPTAPVVVGLSPVLVREVNDDGRRIERRADEHEETERLLQDGESPELRSGEEPLPDDDEESLPGDDETSGFETYRSSRNQGLHDEAPSLPAKRSWAKLAGLAILCSVFVAGVVFLWSILREPPDPLPSLFVVEVSPAGAKVELLGAEEEYAPGMRLRPGEYIVRVSSTGYETHNEIVRHGLGPTVHRVNLERTPRLDDGPPVPPDRPSRSPFVVEVSPAGAKVELLGAEEEYAPGMRLPPDGYIVRVSSTGYVTHNEIVRHGLGPTVHRVNLERTPRLGDGPPVPPDRPSPSPFVVEVSPAGAKVELLGAEEEYASGMRLPPGEYRVRVSSTGYKTYDEAVVHGPESTVHRVNLERMGIGAGSSARPEGPKGMEDQVEDDVGRNELVEPSDSSGPAPDEPLFIRGAVVKPVRIRYVAPQYTSIARRTRTQGVVILRATIDKQGNVTDVGVLKGLRWGLSEAAVEAVKQWKFQPATLNGKSVAVYYKVTVRFKF